MVDAHSKWPEVNGPIKTATAEATANAVRNVFARYGLPKQIVSDNGLPFQSAEYEEFLRQNDIQEILVYPYHLSSNGLAEWFVQSLKHSLESSASDPVCTLQQRVQNVLLSYRGTQHATTGSFSALAKLFLQRHLRARLSLVRPTSPLMFPVGKKRSRCTMTSMLNSKKLLLATQSLPLTT